MAKVLVHVTIGPENPTKAALAFLVAKSVLEEGDELAVFVAGDGVHLISSTKFGTIEGVGTGRLSDHITTLNSHRYLAFIPACRRKLAASDPNTSCSMAQNPRCRRDWYS